VSAEPLANYVFDDHDVSAALVKYFRNTWPDDHGDSEWNDELETPAKATDKQLDEIVKLMGVTFAQVFEVEDDEEDDEIEGEDDLHFGPQR
jgi:hypothetical protein